MTEAHIWWFLATIVPLIFLGVGVLLLAYGLVVWAHRAELRSREPDVIYKAWGKWS